ncbi:MAG: myo-inositol-1-phosphate synthase [bacterium]|nr:myo-inositol-1-phosphate synthase [bacterium]
MAARRDKIGLWMIGACGGVGSTVALGLAALAKGRIGSTGLVTALPELAALDLIDPDRLVVGGHEIRAQTPLEAVRAGHRDAGLFDEELIRACTPALRRMQENIRPGTVHGAGPAIREMADLDRAAEDRTAADAVHRLASDINEFRDRNRLVHVVVAYVGSTERQTRLRRVEAKYEKLIKVLGRRDDGQLPTSSLYAVAAVEAGCSFVNFTPSRGIDLPALRDEAQRRGLSFMGRDGKTGETLVKSVLAPMFGWRNLSILSWAGHNLLGNRDGQALSDPATKAAKIRSKEQVVDRIVGRDVDSHVSIEYMRSLDDWKVAWDFIHFEGFCGTKMSMQFTWQGSDSILAAPLVIDLARLTAHHWQIGRSGAMPHLACFFKAPMSVTEQDYPSQWRRLLAYVEDCASAEA